MSSPARWNALPFPLPPDERLVFLQQLPSVALSEVAPDDSCPVCFSTFEAICSPELAKEDDYSSWPPIASGLARLPCSHVFCKDDLIEWIDNFKGSCPTCRFKFLDIAPPVEDESSDGGEYHPEDDEDEDIQTEAVTSDGDLEWTTDSGDDFSDWNMDDESGDSSLSEAADEAAADPNKPSDEQESNADGSQATSSNSH